MKIEKKISIEILDSDIESFKSAIKKIDKHPNEVGFDKADKLSVDEKEVIAKLNKALL